MTNNSYNAYMKHYSKPTITVLALRAGTLLAGSNPGAEIPDPQLEGSRQLFAPFSEPSLGGENLLPAENSMIDL